MAGKLKGLIEWMGCQAKNARHADQTILVALRMVCVSVGTVAVWEAERWKGKSTSKII